MVAVARREVTVRAPRRATERRAVDVRVRVAGENAELMDISGSRAVVWSEGRIGRDRATAG